MLIWTEKSGTLQIKKIYKFFESTYQNGKNNYNIWWY